LGERARVGKGENLGGPGCIKKKNSLSQGGNRYSRRRHGAGDVSRIVYRSVELLRSCEGNLTGKHFFFKQKTAYEIWSVTGVQTCALPISLSSRAFFFFFPMDAIAEHRLAMRRT